jgi:hypothetical protein
MKTAVTIPWGAVVEGCPPSPKAKALPLVVSRHCNSRSQGPAAHYDWISKTANASSASSLAVGRRSGGSALVELLLVGAEAEAVATLTSDGETSVVVQSLRAPLGTSESFDSDLATDELVRTYVLRYARMDADVRAFVVPDADGGEHRDDDGRKPMQFMRPENWGFRPLTATTTTTTNPTTSWRMSHLSPSEGSHLVNCYCSSNAVLRPPHRNPFDEPPPDRGDPLQCLPPLMHVRAALESGLCSQTYEPHAESLCYWPVLALGRCRLFGVKVAEDQDFTPGPEVFAHASRRLRERLIAILESFADLDGRIVRQGAYGHANLALELLEARMDAHAAYLALDEAYAAALYDGSPEAPAMSRRLTQVRRLINLFDGNLQKNLPLLRLAASTYLLDNWRRLLAPAHRDCPPWWLDGCIG